MLWFVGFIFWTKSLKTITDFMANNDNFAQFSTASFTVWNTGNKIESKVIVESGGCYLWYKYEGRRKSSRPDHERGVLGEILFVIFERIHLSTLHI